MVINFLYNITIQSSLIIIQYVRLFFAANLRSQAFHFQFNAFCLSAMIKKRKPSAKKIAMEATATLMVPPASFTAAIKADPRNDAPLLKMS